MSFWDDLTGWKPFGGDNGTKAQAAGAPPGNQSTVFLAYEAAAKSKQQAIEQNSSLDAVTKEELIQQLAAGGAELSTMPNGQYDYVNTRSQQILSSVDANIASGAGNDPLHLGRRTQEEEANLVNDRPGRLQTILTARDNTPAGTPTLLTSGVPNPLTPLSTPNSLLTGK